MTNKLINEITDYLVNKYQCHSIILYGSYAREDYTSESDIDIICFGDNSSAKNDAGFINGIQLDAWIYSAEKMNDAKSLLHISDGKILLDKLNRCSELMGRIKAILAEGPTKVPQDEKEFLKAWLQKMFVRSQKGDSEGNYRLHWMLKDSLEIYFSLIDQWYLGPKKALKWLHENDKEAYELFEAALRPGAGRQDIENLIAYVNNK